MKCKSEELTGALLEKAVNKAINKSYTELSFKLGAMSLDQLEDYLAEDILASRCSLGCDLSNAESIRALILEQHETEPGSDAQVWGLCEVLLERYGYMLGRRVSGATGKIIWRAEVESEFWVFGTTPREALLRVYITDKLGQIIDLD